MAPAGSESRGMFDRDHHKVVRERTQASSSAPRTRWAIIACGVAMAAACFVASAQEPAAPRKSPPKTHRVVKPKPAVPDSIPEVILPAPPPPAQRVPEEMPPGVPEVSWDG